MVVEESGWARNWTGRGRWVELMDKGRWVELEQRREVDD